MAIRAEGVSALKFLEVFPANIWFGTKARWRTRAGGNQCQFAPGNPKEVLFSQCSSHCPELDQALLMPTIVGLIGVQLHKKLSAQLSAPFTHGFRTGACSSPSSRTFSQKT
jgi:hypothetical protein